MVRRRKKVEDTAEEIEWPFKVSILIKKFRPKIAFLRGTPREYYPEDPGYSKFGLTFGPPDIEDIVNPSYYPSEDRLDKPISLLGYGIGGLSSHPRFPKTANQDYPAPNAYQGQLVPPPVKRKERAKRTKWMEFVAKYEKIAEEQAKPQAEGSKPTRGGEDVEKFKDKTEMVMMSDPKVWCRFGTTAAFGMTTRRPRFDRGITADNPGPGTYEPKPSPLANKSFQITTPQGKFIPNVRIVCIPGGCDICMRCAVQLFKSDYYQTKTQYRVLNKRESADISKYRLAYLSLCRTCYCDALQNGFPPWRKDRIPELFTKARHCNIVHDHQQGQSEFLTKATCKDMLNLSRREVRYSRYFKDNPFGK